jgi:hypothetical protein
MSSLALQILLFRMVFVPSYRTIGITSTTFARYQGNRSVHQVTIIPVHHAISRNCTAKPYAYEHKNVILRETNVCAFGRISISIPAVKQISLYFSQAFYAVECVICWL